MNEAEMNALMAAIAGEFIEVFGRHVGQVPMSMVVCGMAGALATCAETASMDRNRVIDALNSAFDDIEGETAMTILRGARDDMLDEEPSQADLEFFARIAEIDGHALFIEAPPIRQRYGQAIARWIVALAVAVAVAWVLSEIAVAALLDESRLAMLGVV